MYNLIIKSVNSNYLKAPNYFFPKQNYCLLLGILIRIKSFKQMVFVDQFQITLSDEKLRIKNKKNEFQKIEANFYCAREERPELPTTWFIIFFVSVDFEFCMITERNIF